MNPSRVRQKLARSEPAWCVKVSYGDPEPIKLMRSTGFDGIWLCLEHRQFDPATTCSLNQAKADLGPLWDAKAPPKP